MYRQNKKAFRPPVSVLYPKSEDTFWLKTNDYGEAVRAVGIAAAEVVRRSEQHRRQQRGPAQQELTPEQLKLVHDVYYRHLLEEDQEIRVDAIVGNNAAKSFDGVVELNDDLIVVIGY
ncbi:hypothetical protein [Aliiroseovarius sp. 2305UL8-7]|uniref:hypothetical protein n=1 Tax=Aliiroseovarius conchicola TaxID=3121637 RepID=UPI003527F733